MKGIIVGVVLFLWVCMIMAFMAPKWGSKPKEKPIEYEDPRYMPVIRIGDKISYTSEGGYLYFLINNHQIPGFILKIEKEK